ncbi:MAG: translation initiation factor IF-3 [Ilumatobacteraceae bacterium]
MAPPQQPEHRYNDRIRAREVRLIGADGSQLGIKNLPDALALARQQDLDLVEVAPMASPPVCRIMDYGKFRYEESQKAKESRKKTIQVSIKEVKFRPKIGKGDFDTKVRHMQDFLADGHKVKVTLQFRGREMAHPELGSRILDAVIEQVGTHGKVETMARLEGRNMTMVLAPEKKAVVKKPHEPRVHEDKHEDSKAADDAPAAAQPSEEAAAVQEAPEVQAPAEPVAEAVVETVDPA